MNNDNLKRVLNKISGADRASVQQKTPPGYEQNDDMDYQITPTETPTFQEKINKYCACVKNLLDNVSILETEKDGWEAHVKWVTTYCLGSIGVKLNGADPILFAVFNCPGFRNSENFGRCRLECLSRGHNDTTASGANAFIRCIMNCLLRVGPKPPLIDNSGPGGSNLWGSFPWLYWQIRRFILLSPSYPDRPPLIW